MRNISIFKFSCFFLPILMATQFALADLADDMDGAEKLYEAGKYSQAEQGYQNIINKADPKKAYSTTSFELSLIALAMLKRFGELAQTVSWTFRNCSGVPLPLIWTV